MANDKDEAVHAAIHTTANESPPPRKRSLLRRGGGSHITLIRAAALAAMSSPGEEDSGAEDYSFHPKCKRPSALPEMDSQSDSSDRSPRKRLRGPDPAYAAILEKTSTILDGLCVNDEAVASANVVTSDDAEMGISDTFEHYHR